MFIDTFAIMFITKTAQLKVENSAQITFRLSPVSFCTPQNKLKNCENPIYQKKVLNNFFLVFPVFVNMTFLISGKLKKNLIY
jgi:hypothetical protein